MASANNPHPDSTVQPQDNDTDQASYVKTTPNPEGSWPYPTHPTEETD
ncbi:MAG TPA: hypothetical protein VK082_07985 [Paenalcaligenes sp.]|nr:hypothetical protein [Paenalcaligenes sp.]